MDVEKLKQKILDLAIRGKLVPQDPNDEPASVLIEKIKAEKAKLVKEGKIKASKEESYIFKGSDNFYYEKTGNLVRRIGDSNKFPDYPNNWVILKLKQIGDWGAGATPLRGNPNYYKSGSIPWLKTGELNDGFIYDSQEKITEQALKECSLRLNKPGDVLIAMYGATIGKLGIAAINLTTNQACCGCTPYSFINNEFLFYYLMALKDYFLSISFGGAQPNISKEKIEGTLIGIPSINTQLKIVSQIKAILFNISNIEKNQNDIFKYVLLSKKKILDLFFGENSSYKSYYENGSLIDDIEIYDNLRKPISLNEREKRVEKAQTLYPYFGATGQTGVIDDFILEGEYVLLGEDGAPFLDKTADKAYLAQGKIWVNNHAHVLKSKTNNKFLMHYLNWFDYFDYVSGTTRLKLNQAMMKKIPFPIVPEDIKKKIVDKIERAFVILNVIN